MAEVKWAQVLQIRKQRCDPFRKTPVSSDVETPFHCAMKTNVLREPFFPLLTRHATHGDGAIFSFCQQVGDAVEIAFGDSQRKFAPRRTDRLYPII
jgi:hypothetical protein